MEVCNTDRLYYSVSDEQYLVASSLLLLYTVIPLLLYSDFVYTCIQLKQAFRGMGHKNGPFHWKVHPFIVLFKLSLIQNHLRNANVPSLTAPGFFPILGSVHGIPIGATTRDHYIKIRLILNQPEIDFEPFSMYSKRDIKSLRYRELRSSTLMNKFMRNYIST